MTAPVPPASHPRGGLAFPAMLAGSACLAFGPFLVRLADVAPLASAFWRQALAVPFLLVLALRAPAGRGLGAAGGAGLALAALAGAGFAGDLAVWHLGIVRTTLGNASLLANAATFLLPLYALVVLGQRPTRPQWLALAVAAAGVALLLGRSAELSATHLAGDLLCLAAAVFYTLYLVVIEKLRARLDALPALALATLASALVLAPLAAGGRFWPQDWGPVLALAIGSQVIGQGLIVYAVRHLPPLVVGLSFLVQPAIGAAVGAWRFGEMPGPPELAGAALVVAALVIARLPARRA